MRHQRGLDPVVAALVVSDRTSGRAGRRRAGTWKRAPVWRALWSKDRLLAARPTTARARLFPVALLAALSVLVWHVALEPPLVRAIAFALALGAATALGEWVLALSGEDPFSVLRALPVGLRSLWLSRVAWVAFGALALVLAQMLAARGLAPPALHLFVGWIGLATLAIGALATNYGITLFPRAAVARRLFSLSLGIAVAASLMIPLLGWVTLLAALLHSTRRLPRWYELDETAA